MLVWEPMGNNLARNQWRLNVRRSARSLPRDPSSVQGLEYTAKGDEGALEPGGHVLDSAEGSPGDASPPAHADSEEAARARQEEPGTAAAEALETSAPVAQQLESLSTISGMGSSAWTMGNRITHWRLAHQRGYHLDQLTQDKTYRRRVRKHENNCKAAITAGGWGQGTR
ncbi:cation channel sperm-associated auxiliary subunit zeta isoform X4 [Carettochelys insculpta]|uniref:cation channel sperm-associated auxiliary subunit zeta isoform X4 n=1 Tax=Carettochelys insculpta TaxID=44489 RepID=UPI003EBCF32B